MSFRNKMTWIKEFFVNGFSVTSWEHRHKATHDTSHRHSQESGTLKAYLQDNVVLAKCGFAHIGLLMQQLAIVVLYGPSQLHQPVVFLGGQEP